MYKNFFIATLCCAIGLCACDLQPKIASIPDDIGMFINERYPALLADPYKQPEIYNSAVTDYGVYASPELYGSANIDDYVLYASVDDYVLVPDETKTETEDDYIVVPLYGTPTYDITPPIQSKSGEIIVARGDTLYSLARKNNMTVSELAQINNLHEPYTLSVGQRLNTSRGATRVPNVIAKGTVKTPVVANTTTRVNLSEITVAPGDTLYSISRKYEIPVNDLAVMNKLSHPFTLSVGQKLKVPKLDNVKTVSVNEVKKESNKVITPAKKTTGAKTDVKVAKNDVVQSKSHNKNATAQPKPKISSNPKQKLPQITARSASKFSWPLRGKILSAYGAKSNGLFNDGINIAASIGATVKAAENGVVAYAGNEVKGMGNLIIIQHSDGWMTIYAHLDSMSVKRGNRVSVGTPIGRAGKTGKVDQPQLHFEIRKGTKAYNPTQYLKK